MPAGGILDPLTLNCADEVKPTTDINSTSRAPNLKFPVPWFYDEDPELWFWQLEATFQEHKVMTEKDKYVGVVSNLPFKVVRQIPRTISSEKDPFTIDEVKVTDLSDYQRSEKLHALPALGDQRPSEPLASIRTLKPVQDCKCYSTVHQFLSRMPTIMQAGEGEEEGGLLVSWEVWEEHYFLLPALFHGGKQALGELQGLGTSPSPAFCCPSPPPAPAPAPMLPTPPPAPQALFHPQNPPQAADRALACLLWLTNELSNMKMLVDTGAATSVIFRSHVHGSVTALRHQLVGAGGAHIHYYGSYIVPLQFRRRWTWDFETSRKLSSVPTF